MICSQTVNALSAGQDGSAISVDIDASLKTLNFFKLCVSPAMLDGLTGNIVRLNDGTDTRHMLNRFGGYLSVEAFRSWFIFYKSLNCKNNNDTNFIGIYE